ncbi:unnamed protein product, partial [Nesidiocoris tenuis]
MNTPTRSFLPNRLERAHTPVLRRLPWTWLQLDHQLLPCPPPNKESSPDLRQSRWQLPDAAHSPQ